MNLEDVQIKLTKMLYSLEVPKTSLEAEANLLDEAVIDSLQLIDFLILIEDDFGVKITRNDLLENNLGKLPELAKFIHSKIQ